MALTIGAVARLTGLSVRALRHYDEVGLVRPGARSEGGYRLYVESDLQVLQQILFFRELGFPLREIARILGDPRFDRVQALRLQRRLLAARRHRVSAMIAAVDRALGAATSGEDVGGDGMFEGFDQSQYESEVTELWGETDAYAESARRTAAYTAADWERIKHVQGAVIVRLGLLFAAKRPAEDPDVQAAVEEHRCVIDRYFYPCSREMHQQLGAGYATDARFAAVYDAVQPGLAAFMRDATAVAAGDAGG